jgi:hypothetical protein
MREQSQEQDDQLSDKVDGACLVIECYSDGEMGFSCDWQEDDTGISCMATILVHLGDKNISYKILQNLEAMINTDNQQEQLEKLTSFYATLKRIADQNKRVSEDEVVIPPLDASTLM